MRRLLLFIICMLFSVLCYAQTAADYQKLEELEQKLHAVEQMPNNTMAYLSLMPEFVEILESLHVVNAVYVRSLIYLGYFYYAQLDLPTATSTFNKAINILQNNPNIESQIAPDMLDLLHGTLSDLADIDAAAGESYLSEQFKLGNYAAVIQSASTYLQLRKEFVINAYSTFSEQERYSMSRYIEKDINLHYIISAVYYTNDFSIMGDIYDYILFLKQLQLRTTKQVAEAIQQSGDKQLLKQYNEYRAIKKQLALSNPDASLNKDSLQHRLNSLGRLLTLHGNLLKEKETISWRDIQRRLPRGEAAIEFVEFSLFEGAEIKVLDMYAAMIITPTCVQPILKLVNSKRNLTYWHPENPGDLYVASQYGAPLAQLFWTKLLFYMADEDINTIYFAPDGILHTLAIESLPFDDNNPICWNYNLTRLSSTRELAMRHNAFPKKTATLYGNLAYRMSSESMEHNGRTRSAIEPIPSTKAEIDSIKQLLSTQQYRIQVLSRKNGTEESVKSMDGHSPSILHFATHGFVKEDANGDAMRQTGLILSYGARAWEGKAIPKGKEDGILTSAEIAALDLSGTDVVVLSACNTALGEVTPEGVWGLQRAFKQAGVQTVIMSLWHVDDAATAVFMQYFYEEVTKGRRVLDKIINVYHADPEHAFDYAQEALQMAQHRMRQHPKYSSPYYWAAFIAVD